MTEPRTLYYFPWDPDEWFLRTAMLSALARGAYADLRSQAWKAAKRGAPPCSLPDDDAHLARLARLERSEWKRVRAEVRSLLVARDGLLFDDELLVVWEEQSGAYKRRADAGRSGGNAPRKVKQPDGNASTNAPSKATSNAGSKASALLEQSELETGLVPAPDGAGGQASVAADAAPAASGPRVTAARVPFKSNPEPTAQEAAQAAHELAYREQLSKRVAQWEARHPEKAAELQLQARTTVGLPANRELTPAQQRVVREFYLTAVRELNKSWPTLEQWDGPYKAAEAVGV